MANRVKFEFLRGLKKSEEELLQIVQKTNPELTPNDCYITNTFGIISFCTNSNIQSILQTEVTKEI